MITIYDPYSPGPIAPVCKVGQNIGVFTQGAYRFFRAIFIEPIPASTQMTKNIGSVAANSNSSETEITVTRAPEGSLLHVRCRVLDDVEVLVKQVQSSGRFITDTQQSRISARIAAFDPFLATTTMFVLGRTRSIYATVYNRTDYVETQTRLQFFGYRYVLSRLTDAQERILQHIILNKTDELSEEEKAIVRNRVLTATVVPAEGRE